MLQARELCQLHQWQSWQKERGAAWPPLSPELVQSCRDAFSSEEGVASKLQGDVVASLLALWGWPRERRSAPSRATASTPWSCTAGARWRLRSTGTTALKRRQLRAAGWALLPVAYWEWDALDRNAEAKQEFLYSIYCLSQQQLPSSSKEKQLPHT